MLSTHCMFRCFSLGYFSSIWDDFYVSFFIHFWIWNLPPLPLPLLPSLSLSLSLPLSLPPFPSLSLPPLPSLSLSLSLPPPLSLRTLSCCFVLQLQSTQNFKVNYISLMCPVAIATHMCSATSYLTCVPLSLFLRG